MEARNVTIDQLREAIALTPGVRLSFDTAFPTRKDGTGWRFTLKTEGRPPKYGRRGFVRNKNGERRRIAGPVCWHGHRDFMRNLFELAPDTVLITALARYEGKEGFNRDYPASDKQVGSIVDPAYFSELCDCEE